jgi:hypothetical protein
LGTLSDHSGYRPAFVASAALMALAFLVSARLPETRASHL